MMIETSSDSQQMRLAVVLMPGLATGEAVNAAAVVTGALRSDAFCPAIQDKDGRPHAAILWNLVVLYAKTASQLTRLFATDQSVQVVAFSRDGQGFSNSFAAYEDYIGGKASAEIDVIAVGLYGPDPVVRSLTKSFSVYK